MKQLLLLLTALVVSSAAMADTNISGYINVERFDIEGSEPFYDQHHMNIMLQHETDQFKFFTEIEFEHSAKFKAKEGADGDSEGSTDGDAGAGSDAESELDGGRGAVIVERAWIDWTLHKYVTLRSGLMLNNTLYLQNHYPSIINNISRPQIVKKIFDAELEGFRLYGEAKGVIYEYWQGRGSQNPADDTYNKGVSNGFALGYAGMAMNGDLDYSVKYLSGTYSVADNSTTSTSTTDVADDTSTGIELTLNWKNVGLWVEKGDRKSHKTSGATEADRTGIYATLSYAIELDNGREIVPFYMHDSYKDDSKHDTDVVKSAYGFSYRPVPNFSFKMEYQATAAYDDNTGTEQDKSHQWATGLVYFYN
ncbi:MAG: hypothetical protein HON90_02715 [Halobacteriovoraceae bacterium]|nr:hypothetical protein [Halobacteriovoraceae bacterium]